MSNLDVASPNSTKQTIVAVDDDTTIVHLCATVLEQAGFSVMPATNSSEALKICKNHPGPIHLLLTDLVMPPPEFSFASGNNEFPNVHGHELAVRALRMRKDLRSDPHVRQYRPGSGRIRHTPGTSHFFPNRLSTKPWWHSCDTLSRASAFRSKV
jgi:CheY-like chemotaxis protein